MGDEALQQALAESQEQVAAAQGAACNHRWNIWQHTSLALTLLLFQLSGRRMMAACRHIALHAS